MSKEDDSERGQIQRRSAPAAWSMLDDVGLRLSRHDAGDLASRQEAKETRGLTRYTDLSEQVEIRGFLGRDRRQGNAGTALDSERTFRAVLDTLVDAVLSGDVGELKRELPEGFLPIPPETLRDGSMDEVRGRRDDKNTE